VHLEIFFETQKAWKNSQLIEKWKRIRELRRVVTGALELERAAKKIGSSLEAAPTLYVSDKQDAEILNSVPFDEIAITSGIAIKQSGAPDGAFALNDVKDAAAVFAAAPGDKCERCWRVLPEVTCHQDHLCDRCEAAIGGKVEA
jgi:isoleucyl-tRNA synthetase